MIRATSVVRRLAVKPERVADTIVLERPDRHRGGMVLRGAKGTEFLLDLDKAASVKGGDAFRLEDGRLVEVVAAPEALLEIRAATPSRLARIAWHIGNRRIAAEITGDAIYVEDGSPVRELCRGLGAAIGVVSRPFEPERGAEEGDNHRHAHDPGHGHHGHGVERDRLHLGVAPHAEHDHDHGGTCGCGHHHHEHDHSHDHACGGHPKGRDGE